MRVTIEYVMLETIKYVIQHYQAVISRSLDKPIKNQITTIAPNVYQALNETKGYVHYLSAYYTAKEAIAFVEEHRKRENKITDPLDNENKKYIHRIILNQLIEIRNDFNIVIDINKDNKINQDTLNSQIQTLNEIDIIINQFKQQKP